MITWLFLLWIGGTVNAAGFGTEAECQQVRAVVVRELQQASSEAFFVSECTEMVLMEAPTDA